jgi:hypothetical protein
MEIEARAYGTKGTKVVYLMLIWVDSGILTTRTLLFERKCPQKQVKTCLTESGDTLDVSFEEEKNAINVGIKLLRKGKTKYIRCHVSSMVSCYTLIEDNRNLFNVNS